MLRTALRLVTMGVVLSGWAGVAMAEEAAPAAESGAARRAVRKPAPPNTAYVELVVRGRENERPAPNVRLMVRRNDGHYETVCYAPCGLPVPIGERYQVEGEDMLPTADVVLEAREHESVRWSVLPTSKEIVTLAAVLGSTGAGTALGAVALHAFGDAMAGGLSGSRQSTSYSTTEVAVVGLGVGAFVAALAVVIASGSSRIVRPAAPAPAAALSASPPVASVGGEARRFTVPLTLRF